MSTTEVQYVVADKATKEALWLIRLVIKLSVGQDGVQLHWEKLKCHLFDKQSSVSLQDQPIDVIFYKIRELLASR